MKIEKNNIAHLREEYDGNSLDLSHVAENPIKQFEVWFQETQKNNVSEPNVMTLATSTLDGKPSARIVLLKGIDEGGFLFFTNYGSRKAEELALNPNAALVFCWLELQRQVRIEGVVEKVSEKDSKEYFQSRPKGSQIGAWASAQSTVIRDRDILEKKAAELETEFANEEKLPLPEFWGGYKLIPSVIEFWQGRVSRLHDRIRYTRQSNKKWKIERLAP